MHRRINFAVPFLFALSLTIPPAICAQQKPVAPPLSVDRDPVPSPDAPATPAAAGAAGTDAQSQADQIQRAGSTYTLHTEVGEVRLNASVVDGNGRSVQTLPPTAFTVFEDGVQQTISSLRHEDLPVSLGILIDSSGSMYDKRAAVGKASLNLIKLSNPKDEAFLVDFSFDPYIDADFTHDIKKLEEGLNYVKASGGT
ncbi:MAG: VWA domain-containing protein, partial [Terriglobus sp.]